MSNRVAVDRDAIIAKTHELKLHIQIGVSGTTFEAGSTSLFSLGVGEFCCALWRI